MAVTKYVGPAEIRALVAAGCIDLGESRPQQLWQRAIELGDLLLCWHIIGQGAARKPVAILPACGTFATGCKRALANRSVWTSFRWV